MTIQSNLDKYKTELADLVKQGFHLFNAMQWECYPEEYRKSFAKNFPGVRSIGKKFSDHYKKLPSFKRDYQKWYSEARAVVKLLLPDRVSDFVNLYEKPKGRKEITVANYVIEDYLQGLAVMRQRGEQTERLVSPDAAISGFEQQVYILSSASKRFDSSLFDIRQMVQADLFDSELDAAAELKKNKFLRAGGAVAGVVLEKHLAQVCANHNISITKKDPTIGDLNDLLKQNGAIEIPTWRFIQHLGDLRNLCDHNKKKEPTSTDVDDLISGVGKISKTIF